MAVVPVLLVFGPWGPSSVLTSLPPLSMLHGLLGGEGGVTLAHSEHTAGPRGRSPFSGFACALDASRRLVGPSSVAVNTHIGAICSRPMLRHPMRNDHSFILLD